MIMLNHFLLTARSEQEDIIKGLEAGADDYLIKTISISSFNSAN